MGGLCQSPAHHVRLAFFAGYLSHEARTDRGLPQSALTGSLPEPKPGRWRFGLILLAAVAVVALALLAFRLAVPPLPLKVSGYAQLTNDGRAKLWPQFREYGPLVTDGSRVYFVESPFVAPVLSQVSALGGETSIITAPFPVNRIGDISPDRSALLTPVFAAQEDEAPLWALPLPGGMPRRLGELSGYDGTWSPDGQRILFATGHDLYLARTDGTESRKLASLPGFPWWPRWSPDGLRLRVSLLDPATGSDSLWEVRADGTHVYPLLPNWNKPPQECCGSWTPDGGYFVFQSTHNNKTQLWGIPEKRGTFRKARGEPAQLTAGPMSYFSPVASVNGKQLFAIGSPPRGELQRFNQKAQQFEPYLAGISAEGLDFSRDGQWVTYTSYPEGSLWRSKTDGSERLQLTFPPVQVEALGRPVALASACRTSTFRRSF